jgi:hypothetical protein
MKANLDKHQPFVWSVVAGTILMLSSPGCGSDAPQVVHYVIPGSETQFVVRAKQRLPKMFGGEENVSLSRLSPSGSGPEYRFDHNGRFLRQLKVDAGNGGQWARVYLELDPPLMGESLPFKTNSQGEVSRVFRDYRTGQTSVSNTYRFNVLAFIDFSNGKVINALLTNSTLTERNGGVFGLTLSMPDRQELRGTVVHWNHTSVMTNEHK